MSGQPGASSGGFSGAGNGGGGQAGGGAPAPGQGQGRAPQPGGNSQAAAGGQGAEFDFRKEIQRTREDLTSSFGKQLGEVKAGKNKSDQILAKIQRAFESEDGDGERADPHASRLSQLEAEMDSIIEQAYEADKRGQPIPLTAKANITALQTAIQLETFQQQLLARLAKLEGGVQQANNPEVVVDRQAYSNMDGLVASTLDQIYGDAGMATDTKKFQFQAITSQMTQAIKQIKASSPDQWEQIRRSPQLQQKMVQHFVKQTLPPKAVAIMEQEHLENTPLTLDDLWSAFRQAKQAYANDPETGRKVREKIRQQILEHSLGGQSGASQGGRRR